MATHLNGSGSNVTILTNGMPLDDPNLKYTITIVKARDVFGLEGVSEVDAGWVIRNGLEKVAGSKPSVSKCPEGSAG